MDDEREMGRTASRRKTASNLTFCVKKEKDGKYRKVSQVLNHFAIVLLFNYPRDHLHSLFEVSGSSAFMHINISF